MNTKPDKWFAVSITVTPEYVNAAESAFDMLDTLGSEVDLLSQPNSDLCTVTAYFLTSPDDESIENQLANAAKVHGLSPDIDFVIRHSIVENQDWLAEWKKYWKPVEIGRFIIAAPWHEVGDDAKTVIRIEPNMAFGTGTHETTQLCLTAIDKYYQPGQSFLDVGTGTGILAIAAATIAEGDEKIAAVDTDVEAVAIARANAELNNVSSRIDFSDGSIDTETNRFDFVCANLTADAILPLLPLLLDKAANTLVLSGILAEQEQLILEKLPENLRPEVNQAGEWIAMIIRT